jgi:diacylglycerol kinase family enzyme
VLVGQLLPTPHIDGEIRGSTPTRVGIEPNALRVLAPAGFIDT